MPKQRVQQLNQPERNVHAVNVGESEQWTGNRRFIFLLPSSRAPHSFRTSPKMPRSPHKSPAVMLCRLETDNKISNVLGVKFEATNIEMNF